MVDLDLSECDVEEVMKRLILRGIWLFSALASLPAGRLLSGVGAEPADLASAALQKFLDPTDTTVAWSSRKGKPTTKGVVAFLGKVMENDLRDMLRNKSHELTVIADVLPGAGGAESGAPRVLSLDEFAAQCESQGDRAIRARMIDWLLAKFDNAPILRDVLAAQLDPDGYQARTNVELADLLGTSVSDIENRKKRIQRRLLEIYREQECAKHREATNG